jgi:hypothetical protein
MSAPLGCLYRIITDFTMFVVNFERTTSLSL